MQLIEVTTGFETRDANGNEVVATVVAIDVATVVATVDCNWIDLRSQRQQTANHGAPTRMQSARTVTTG